ncbi:MAG: hypothetical protein WB988_00660, partial [Candidatus Nitrosopolaris sp.]
KELVTHLPLRGKGFDVDYRTIFAIDIRTRPCFLLGLVVYWVCLDDWRATIFTRRILRQVHA